MNRDLEGSGSTTIFGIIPPFFCKISTRLLSIFGLRAEIGNRNFSKYKAEQLGVRLHEEEICGLCPSPNVIPQIQQRRVKWAGAGNTFGKQERCIGGFD